MLAILEKTNQGELVIVSGDSFPGIKIQIEMILNSQINPALWTQLLNGETIDGGQYQIAMFDTNSIITAKLKMRTIVNLAVQRDSFNYSHGQ